MSGWTGSRGNRDWGKYPIATPNAAGKMNGIVLQSRFSNLCLHPPPTMLHILWSIIIGFFIGLIARAILPGAQDLGFWLTAGLGIAGSFVGGLIGQVLKKPEPGAPFHPAGLLLSILGAVLLLFGYTKFIH